MVLVGDRGMISKASIEQLQAERFGWITALKSGQIRSLLSDGALQMDLFDERNLFELEHPGLPGRASRRLPQSRPRQAARAQAHRADRGHRPPSSTRCVPWSPRGTLRGAAAIGVRVGKVLNKYKVAKHFELTIERDAASASRCATTRSPPKPRSMASTSSAPVSKSAT